MELAGKSFELIENDAGLASTSTVMVFCQNSESCQATYSGPNMKNGHVIVSGDQMLYHAISINDELSAGRASMTFLPQSDGGIEMRLQWQWLTGDKSEGVSRWRLLNSV